VKKILGFVVSAVLAGIGICFWCVAIYALVESFRETGFNVVAPGTTAITISKPGDYTLWNRTKTMIDGQFLTFPDQIPSGTTIKIFKKPEGLQIPMRPSMGSSVEVNGSRRVSIGVLTFDATGNYEVVVTGLSEKRALYLDESKFLRTFTKFFGAGLAGFAFVVAGIGLGVYVLLRLVKTKPAPNG
jgi:hypothetical protein